MKARGETDYDVIVIGGSFSGASTALLLRRWVPNAKVLVVERSEVFDRKVGEATVEVSAFFLHRVLGLYDLLSREHLPKHGLRFWVADGPERSLAEMVEIGSSGPPSLPTFQIDRATLDEKLIALAAEEGADLLRPGRVIEVDTGWPRSRVVIETEGEQRTLSARWIVDASGRQAFLARKMGIHERTESHPTAAAWARYRGVKDLDGAEVLGTDPRKSTLTPILASRRLATNHFCGYGWWCWTIPLAGGETSVGVVYNKDLFRWPTEGTQRERFESFVSTQPGLRELLDGAEIDGEDFKALQHLPYRSTRYMDRGWAVVGDAGAFLDPFYSPGLDHCSVSVFATVRILEKELVGDLDEGPLDEAITIHNESFERAYNRWLDALYLNKYEIMGDAQLLAASFLMDTGLYYQGVVAPIYRDLENLALPPFGPPLPQATFAYYLVRFYNRRLVRIARFRRVAGIYGRKSAGWRDLRKFSLGVGGFRLVLGGVGHWFRAEIETFFQALVRGFPRIPDTPVK